MNSPALSRQAGFSLLHPSSRAALPFILPALALMSVVILIPAI